MGDFNYSNQVEEQKLKLELALDVLDVQMNNFNKQFNYEGSYKLQQFTQADVKYFKRRNSPEEAKIPIDVNDITAELQVVSDASAEVQTDLEEINDQVALELDKRLKETKRRELIVLKFLTRNSTAQKSFTEQPAQNKLQIKEKNATLRDNVILVVNIRETNFRVHSCKRSAAIALILLEALHKQLAEETDLNKDESVINPIKANIVNATKLFDAAIASLQQQAFVLQYADSQVRLQIDPVYNEYNDKLTVKRENLVADEDFAPNGMSKLNQDVRFDFSSINIEDKAKDILDNVVSEVADDQAKYGEQRGKIMQAVDDAMLPSNITPIDEKLAIVRAQLKELNTMIADQLTTAEQMLLDRKYLLEYDKLTLNTQHPKMLFGLDANEKGVIKTFKLVNESIELRDEIKAKEKQLIEAQLLAASIPSPPVVVQNPIVVVTKKVTETVVVPSEPPKQPTEEDQHKFIDDQIGKILKEYIVSVDAGWRYKGKRQEQWDFIRDACLQENKLSPQEKYFALLKLKRDLDLESRRNIKESGSKKRAYLFGRNSKLESKVDNAITAIQVNFKDLEPYKNIKNFGGIPNADTTKPNLDAYIKKTQDAITAKKAEKNMFGFSKKKK